MAIMLDNKSTVGVDSTTATLSHACGGGNRLLVVAVAIDGTETISSITYAGVNMVLATSVAPPLYSMYLYYLVAPALGVNNISITISAIQDFGLMAVSYTGIDQANPLAAVASTASDSATPYGGAITPTTNGSLAILASSDTDNTANVRTPLAGTNERHDVILGEGAGAIGGYFSDILNASAASTTLTYTDATVTNSTNIRAAFNPAAAPSFRELKVRPAIFTPGVAR